MILDEILETIDESLIEYHLSKFKEENSQFDNEIYLMVKAYIKFNLEQRNSEFAVDIKGKRYYVRLIQ